MTATAASRVSAEKGSSRCTLNIVGNLNIFGKLNILDMAGKCHGPHSKASMAQGSICSSAAFHRFNGMKYDFRKAITSR